MLTFSEFQIKVKKNYLVVFLQDVVHLGHIFACNGLDDVSFVIGRVEPSSTACLGVVGEGCTPGQGILPVGIRWEQGREPVKDVAFRFPDNLSSQLFKTHLYLEEIGK